jgi:RNA polymerase sigma-70 factor (ECF subfamily)
VERWRHQSTHANGQLAVGCYLFEAASGRYEPAVLDVLTLDGEKIAAVTAFLLDDTNAAETFASFGLPADPSQP